MIVFFNSRLAKMARELVNAGVGVDIYTLLGCIADRFDFRVDVVD